MARFRSAAANDEVLEADEPGLGLRFEPATADCGSVDGRFGTLWFSCGPRFSCGPIVGAAIDVGGSGFDDKTEKEVAVRENF